jgi:hypothetical protein
MDTMLEETYAIDSTLNTREVSVHYESAEVIGLGRQALICEEAT